MLEQPGTGNISLQVGTGLPSTSNNEFFLKTAANPVFPFLHAKLVEADTEGVSVEIKVNKTVYEFLQASNPSGDVVFYLTGNGLLSQWNSDMVMSMKILSDLGIMSSVDKWITDARKSITGLLHNQKTEPIFDNKLALDRSKELLSLFGVLDEVQNSELLFSTATEVLNEKAMDSDTLIYRLSMALYHSGTGTGRSILPAIDDPGSAYLRLVGDPSYDKWKSIFSNMMTLPLESRIQIIRTLLVFTVASYVYHKIIAGERHGH